jgi:hypothetical protein
MTKKRVICYCTKKHMAMLFRIESRKEVVDTSDVFISTIVEASGLIALEVVSTPPLIVSLDGAIELLAKENLLAIAKF